MLGILALVFGLVAMVGWIWIVIMAFQNDGALWGLLCFFLSPLSIVYGIMNFGTAKVPLLMLIIGIVGQIGFGLAAAATGLEGIEGMQGMDGMQGMETIPTP